ncbi:MAG: hypothetical protein D3904_04410 [Candidatus Electrothrix sp. EH2]|nr:hypothetical protein [Candidatus Electrothrix sp. EH2]
MRRILLCDAFYKVEKNDDQATIPYRKTPCMRKGQGERRPYSGKQCPEMENDRKMTKNDFFIFINSSA